MTNKDVENSEVTEKKRGFSLRERKKWVRGEGGAERGREGGSVDQTTLAGCSEML